MAGRRQRLQQLRNRIRVEQQTSIEALSTYFGVSTATIRRDLKELEKAEGVVQTFGGGVIYQNEYTGAVDPRNSAHAIEEKIRIAEYCTELVRDHDDILIGPGTTTFLAGKIMSGITDRKFRIITNSLELAVETSVAPNIRTVMIGGEVWNKHTGGLEAGAEYFGGCHHEHTFLMSADGVNEHQGATVFESVLVPLAKRMIEISNRVILAIDSSKIGRARYHQVATIDQLSIVVTDSGAPREFVERITDRGIKVVCV